ncbi:hypothetical protein BSKO_12274 [Bryopsis sp. KO-2023]|nr:hypothetical protein BSKO_12274 [Bryopsis sp. KO-2023]
MLRVASSVCNRLGNTAGRCLSVDAKPTSHCWKERVDQSDVDLHVSNPNASKTPPAESEPFDEGQCILQEFDSMAAYTQMHTRKKPRFALMPMWTCCFQEIPEELEDWFVEWESIKLAWDACAQMALDCDCLDARLIANIIHRCKAGGYVNKLLLTVLLDRMRKLPKGGKLGQSQVSMIVQSLGMLARMHRDVGDNLIFGSGQLVVEDGPKGIHNQAGHFFDAQCLDYAYSLMRRISLTGSFPRSYSIRTYSSILHGLGLLYQHHLPIASQPVESMVDRIVRDFCRKAATEPFLPLNLEQVLHTCACLDRGTYVEELCNLVEHSMRRGVFFSEQGISNIVWSLGKLNMGSAALFRLLWGAIIQKRSDFTGQGWSMIMHGLGLRALHAGFYPTTLDLQMLGWEIKRPRRLRGFRNTDLVILATGFGILGFRDADVVEAMVAEMERRIRGRRDLVKLWAEQRWRREIGPGLWRSYLEDGFEEEASSLTKLWEPEQVSLMEDALGRSISITG